MDLSYNHVKSYICRHFFHVITIYNLKGTVAWVFGPLAFWIFCSTWSHKSYPKKFLSSVAFSLNSRPLKKKSPCIYAKNQRSKISCYCPFNKLPSSHCLEWKVMLKKEHFMLEVIRKVEHGSLFVQFVFWR